MNEDRFKAIDGAVRQRCARDAHAALEAARKVEVDAHAELVRTRLREAFHGLPGRPAAHQQDGVLAVDGCANTCTTLIRHKVTAEAGLLIDYLVVEVVPRYATPHPDAPPTYRYGLLGAGPVKDYASLDELLEALTQFIGKNYIDPERAAKAGGRAVVLTPLDLDLIRYSLNETAANHPTLAADYRRLFEALAPPHEPG